MPDHSSSSPSTTTPPTADGPAVNWKPIHGLVQIAAVVYDKDRGWLSVQRGIIYGGHHGEAPLILAPFEDLHDIVQGEVRTGLRALQARWMKP